MERVVFLWSSWESIFRIILVGVFTFFYLVLLLRLSGKRTLSRMSAFDFVIAITIGSAFGRILTASSVSISESIVSFGLLISLQVIHSSFFRKLIIAEPTLLYHKGEYLEENMRKVRVKKDVVCSAARKKRLWKYG